MRVGIVLAATVLLFACERAVDSPEPYGVGSGYGGPVNAYASSSGGSVFLVVPTDATDFIAQADAPGADGANADVPYDLGFETFAAAKECLDEHAGGWEEFCACEYDPEKPELQHDDFCRCKFLVCMEDEEQHSSVIGDGWEVPCIDALEAAGELPGSCVQ